jgi:hypothetical protein
MKLNAPAFTPFRGEGGINITSLSMEIELLDITPESQWPVQKQEDWKHLKVLHARIMEHPDDVTNKFADFNSLAMVYARYADSAESRFMLHAACSKSPAYDEEKVNSGFDFFAKDNKLKGNKKLCTVLKHYSIDTTNPDKGSPITTESELAAYLPADVDPRFVLENGFYPYDKDGKTGYYFKTGDKTFSKKSNFIIKPLMHVYSKQDNKRIIEITNGFQESVIDMPSRNLINIEGFSGTVYEEGNFLFWGNKMELLKIVEAINHNFTVCVELKTLGWQPDGFFSWSNAIFADGRIEPFNDLGIATHKSRHYYSPSVSSIYANLSSDDDEYENDRYLYYNPAPFSFEEWCRLMARVYPEHALFGIAFVWIGLFKDLVFKIDNNCPMLSCYGEKGSGKSKFCESISGVFLNDLQPFNLNHGTDFAFFNRLARFRNCVTWFDEFDDQAIKEDRFQSIKGAYDGAGRERGKGTNKNRTEVSRINSALLLSGQYLSTRDDNAALSRCIVIPFTPNENRTPGQIADYDKLKSAEKKGLSGMLTELLPLRKNLETQYPRVFPEVFKTLRDAITERKWQFKERILRNYAAVACLYKLIGEHFKLPFTYADVQETCMYHVNRLSTQMSQSDSLANFWDTMEYLADVKDLAEGQHYKVETMLQLEVLDGDKNKKVIKWKEPTKLLFFRINTIHKMYLDSYRRGTGKTGIDFQSLMLYLGSQPYFVGYKKSHKFKDEHGHEKVTSCHVINLELLPLQLGNTMPEDDNKSADVLIGTLDHAPKIVTYFNKPAYKFNFTTSPTYENGQVDPKSAKTYTCYYPDLRNTSILTPQHELKLTGIINIKKSTNSSGETITYFNMEVGLVELATPVEAVNSVVDIEPF